MLICANKHKYEEKVKKGVRSNNYYVYLAPYHGRTR